MIRLFRKIRHQLLSEDRYSIYFLYAAGEVLLVVVGILLALQIDNWNQNRIQKQVEIDNIESIYFSFNENMQVDALRTMLEFAIRGEQLWIDYLDGRIPFSDSLLDYGYYIGATAFLSPNRGFYESLKVRGLETIENKELRNRLSVIYEQNFPEIQRAMEYFITRFSEERIRHFKKYFLLGTEFNREFGVNLMHFDYSMYKIKRLLNLEDMMKDREFREFVLVSYTFHMRTLLRLERISNNIEQAQSRVFYELNYLKYGTPKRRSITIELKGFQDAEVVHVSGEFNNWRPDAAMLRTPTGWERSFDLFPGSYEYKFILNGDIWIMDPENADSTFVPEVGTFNSVLRVAE